MRATDGMIMFHEVLPFFWVEPTPVFGRPGVPPPSSDEPSPVAAAHTGPVMVLESSVTVPASCANSRPFKVAPVFIALTPSSAKILPMKEVVVSKVAELPILHQTLQGSPPVTDEPGEVMSVDTVLKIQTPDPVRFRFPLSEKLLVEQ